MLPGIAAADVMQQPLQSLLWTVPTHLNRVSSNDPHVAKQQHASSRLGRVATCAWQLLLELARGDAPVYAVANTWLQKLADAVVHNLHGSQGAASVLAHLLWVCSLAYPAPLS